VTFSGCDIVYMVGVADVVDDVVYGDDSDDDEMGKSRRKSGIIFRVA
jgi:hypothetical protein